MGQLFFVLMCVCYYICNLKQKQRCYNNNLLKLRRKVFCTAFIDVITHSTRLHWVWALGCVYVLSQSFVLLGIKGQEK